MKKLFKDQARFNKLVEKYKSRTRDEITKELALALHSEVSDLVSATSYRSHRKKKIKPDIDKILFESVDIVRYTIAILNEWNICHEDFLNAWQSKDTYLNSCNRCENNIWNGEKVAIIDIDDVLCEFRQGFSKWLLHTHSIVTDVESSEYYFISALEETGHNPEKIFESFISDSGFLNLDIATGGKEFMDNLKDDGYFVHILTARPGNNLRCVYNTFEWLENNKIYFDKIDFASEKLRWCIQSDYWCKNSISFAVDDSPKHAAEYSKHGVKTFFPDKSYNKELESISECFRYESFEKIIKMIKNN